MLNRLQIVGYPCLVKMGLDKEFNIIPSGKPSLLAIISLVAEEIEILVSLSEY